MSMRRTCRRIEQLDPDEGDALRRLFSIPRAGPSHFVEVVIGPRRVPSRRAGAKRLKNGRFFCRASKNETLASFIASFLTGLACFDCDSVSEPHLCEVNGSFSRFRQAV